MKNPKILKAKNQATGNTALIIGAHVEEIEAELALLPQVLVKAGWRVVILNPVGGWNWVRLRKLKDKELKEFKQSCYRAAEILGAEKIILDYDIGSFPECTNDMMKDMARIIYDIRPKLVFIPWIRDTHQDHRHLAAISYRLFNGSHFVTQTDEIVPPENYQYEVWAYPAGISQTYDFWPDAVVAGDPEMLEVVKKANEEFAHLDAQKRAGFTNNVKRKTSFWSVYGNNQPSEAVKFIGPAFPLGGTLLKEVLKERVFPVSAGPILCAKEYME